MAGDLQVQQPLQQQIPHPNPQRLLENSHHKFDDQFWIRRYAAKVSIMSTPHTTLGAASDDRKARLAKLKSLKRKQPEDEIVPPESDRQKSPAAPAATGARADSSQEPAAAEGQEATEEEAHARDSKAIQDIARMHLSGRNYDAETKGPKFGFEAPPTLGPDEQTLEEQAAELEAEVRRKAAEDERDDKGVDLFKLQPKKPNWDLKRELNKKLEVLNVRTDNAIARLVRERLQARQDAAQKEGGPGAANGDAATAALEGGELEEIVRLREKEEEEEERIEREAVEAV